LQCDQGISWIDARYPGSQAALERMFKLMGSAALGKVNYPTGALGGNTVFSPEQAIIDIEMGTAVSRLLDGTAVTEETLCLDLIQDSGIGANFFSEEHTAKHFRDSMWLTKLLDRSAAACEVIDMKQDIVTRAYEKWRSVLDTREPYQIEEDKAKEIDKIVSKGEELILAQQ